MYYAFVFLFEHLQNLDYLPSRHYISEKLNEAGFEYEEIVNVLKCFDHLFNEDKQYSKRNMPNLNSRMRVFSAEEVLAIPSDIRGYLHFLYQQQVIDYYEIEVLIHAIMKMDPDELDLETVKVITLITAWVNQSEIPILIGDELLNSLYSKTVLH